MKKTLTRILLLMLAISLLTACGAPVGSGPEKKEQVGEPVTRTVTDMVGRTVEVPEKAERLCALANTPRMLTYLGIADKIVAISGFNYEKTDDPTRPYAFANKELWKDLPVVGTDSGGATDYYPEEIIAAKPDVVLCSYSAELANEIQTKTGVPVVAVSTGRLFDEDYDQALRVLGDVCGVPERAEEVIKYIKNSLKDLNDRTKDIPDEGKPTVLTAAVSFKGRHGIEGVGVKSKIFQAINANDVSKSIDQKVGGFEVDREQIIKWNPEYLFLDTGGIELVRKDYKEHPEYFGQLQAFKNGKVYLCPSATNYYSNVEIPLANAYFDATILYPEQFEDIDFKEKANEIFKFFLGVDNYLEKLEQAGYGYQKLEFDK